MSGEHTTQFAYFSLKRIAIIAALAILLALSAVSFSASAAVPDPPKPLQIEAWMPTSWDADLARTSFTTNARHLSVVSPFWYSVSPQAQLLPLRGARDAELIIQAHESEVLVIPTINNGFDRQLVHTILQDEALAQQLRQSIMAEALAYRFDGIDIDFENIAAEDRDAFSEWINLLAQDLHRHHLLLTVTVQPKTFDFKGWNGAYALDYQALGAAADEVRIMAYGWCWAGGCAGNNPPPGPIAPLHWQQQVVRYAKTQIPAQKIILGIHLYGYDWPAPPPAAELPTQKTVSYTRELWRTWQSQQVAWGPPAIWQWWQICFSHRDKLFPQPLEPVLVHSTISPRATDVNSLSSTAGKAVVWQQAHALLQQSNAQLHWWQDTSAGPVGEPWFSYGHDTRTVTFANADSVRKRIDLARTEGLRGVIFWRLGGEDPAIWTALH